MDGGSGGRGGEGRRKERDRDGETKDGVDGGSVGKAAGPFPHHTSTTHSFTA